MTPRKLVFLSTQEQDAPESRTMRAASLRLVALLAALGALAGWLALAPRAEAFVYWADASNVGRADFDGSNIVADFVVEPDRVVDSVATDGNHLYYTRGDDEPGQEFIGRANLPNATSVDRTFIGTEGFPRGVAVDAAHVYWTNSGGLNAIGRADLDGSNVDQSFVPLNTAPSAVEVGGGHIYWTAAGAIGRADLDGSNVDPDFIASPSPPGATGGLAVNATHIFWAINAGSQFGGPRIGRANLNGTGIDRRFLTDGVDEPWDVAVDATHVYWTDHVFGGSIGRANLDGSNVDQNFIGVFAPGGVAVDALSTPPPPAPSPPSNDFSFGKVKKNKRKGTAKLTVEIVEGPGELELTKTKKVKADDEAVAGEGASEQKLTIKGKGKARKRLNKKGKAKVKAGVTYTPDGGEPNIGSKKIKLVKR